MNHIYRSLHFARTLSYRAFLLVFPCLAAVAPRLYAQIEKNPDVATCVRASESNSATSTNSVHPAQNCATRNSSDASLVDTVAPDAPAPAVTATTPGQQQTTLINHRLLGVVANYTTVETQDQFGVLSPATKFKLSAKTMTDPVTVSFLAGLALLGQARNSDPTYGQGFSGYDKRFATIYADTGIGTLMTTSVFPTVLHQDPRYFQLGSGGFRRRMLHAVSSILIAHNDQGALQLNYSQLVGNAVAAGISNAYHPEAQRTLGNTLHVWSSDTLLNMLCNVAKEFWPDVRHKLHNAN